MKTLEIAERIAKAAEAMGLWAERSSSQLSRSQYVRVWDPDRPDIDFKIRVSDHVLPPSYGFGGHFEVGNHMEANGDWADCLAWLAKKAGKPVPAIAKARLTVRRKEEERLAALAAARAAREAAERAQLARDIEVVRAAAAADPALAEEIRAAVSRTRADRRNKACDRIAARLGVSRQAVKTVGWGW